MAKLWRKLKWLVFFWDTVYNYKKLKNKSYLLNKIIMTESNRLETKERLNRNHPDAVNNELFNGILVKLQIISDQADNVTVNCGQLSTPLFTCLSSPCLYKTVIDYKIYCA